MLNKDLKHGAHLHTVFNNSNLHIINMVRSHESYLQTWFNKLICLIIQIFILYFLHLITTTLWFFKLNASFFWLREYYWLSKEQYRAKNLRFQTPAEIQTAKCLSQTLTAKYTPQSLHKWNSSLRHRLLSTHATHKDLDWVKNSRCASIWQPCSSQLPFWVWARITFLFWVLTSILSSMPL